MGSAATRGTAAPPEATAEPPKLIEHVSPEETPHADAASSRRASSFLHLPFHHHVDEKELTPIGKMMASVPEDCTAFDLIAAMRRKMPMSPCKAPDAWHLCVNLLSSIIITITPFSNNHFQGRRTPFRPTNLSTTSVRSTPPTRPLPWGAWRRTTTAASTKR